VPSGGSREAIRETRNVPQKPRKVAVFAAKRGTMQLTFVVRDRCSRGALHALGTLGATLFVALTACAGREETRSPVGSAGAAGGSSLVAEGGGGQSPRNEAGASSAEQAGTSGLGDDAGAGGESGQALGCEPGGALFAAGNYSDRAGNELWLRETATATTLALIPSGVARPAMPPRLFRVERVCASGAELIAQDEIWSYRVDFLQSGGELSLCFSPAAATVESAIGRAGCVRKSFTVFTKEAR
jgi:hypothetical protein